MYYKSVLIKFIIFALGAGAGFLTAKKVYEEYYAALAQEEIDSVKERFESNWKPRYTSKEENSEDHEMTVEEYREKNKRIMSSNFDGDTNSDISESNKNQRTNRNSLTRSSLDDNPNERAKRNYNLVGAKPEKVVLPEPEEDEEEGDEEDGPVTDAAGKTHEEMDLTKVDRTKPYIIDDEEFTNEFDQHEKVSLYYYKVDDVLCEENEGIVKDREEKIGYDALSALDMQTTVWVRNEPLCIDYEIISINKSYAEAVNGMAFVPVLSPREIYVQKQRERDNREG
jgi:hypothetical protein